MPRSFNQYTDAELLMLDNDTINDAIRIEAIERGVEPPITLSEALRKSEWRGYARPAEAVAIFELCVDGKYSSLHCSGIGYLDEAKANAALEGIVFVEEITYGSDKGTKIQQGRATVQRKLCGVSKSEQAWSKVEEYTQDNTKFNEVSSECVNRLSAVRQADYTKRVNQEKRAEYLRLAAGNEDIAKGFWRKIESGDFPESQPV